jgi:hypothetical protein
MVEELPRLARRSLRKVSRSELVPDVPVVLLDVLDVLDVLLDELLPEAAWIADTRLLKSDFSVSRVLSVEDVDEVEEVDEVDEVPPNSEIRFSIVLAKLE